MQTERQMFESIMLKVHKTGGDEAIRRFIETEGEDCPPIKLTAEEMEFLKGGGLWSWIKSHLKEIVAGAQIIGGVISGNPVMFASGVIKMVNEIST